MRILSSDIRNNVLRQMQAILDRRREDILKANRADLKDFKGTDPAMYDRLVVEHQKIDEMIQSVEEIAKEKDPIGQERYAWTHSNGLRIYNRTAPFGTILIIYESRPDVTIEAASVAFKSNNKILLKGGKEAKNTNLVLVECWIEALHSCGLSEDWICYLDIKREETQEFLRNPSQKIDLIVPRGGEGLIRFVKQYASCPVLVSGRGNNFVYVHDDADWEMAKKIIVHSKTDKVSACNALDKVLIHRGLPSLRHKWQSLIHALQSQDIEVRIDIADKERLEGISVHWSEDAEEWYKEYLDRRILLRSVEDNSQAIDWINRYSGGHSAAIVCTDEGVAHDFMLRVDAAAVYHNASTRFTDGGQMGMGAELAISTDKLHHRGPLGLQQLVTNKWFVFGEGQIRK